MFFIIIYVLLHNILKNKEFCYLKILQHWGHFNHWFKYLKGKFGLLQKLKFLWVKAFIPNNKFTGLVFGVVPEWQGRGVDSYIIAESAKVIQRKEPPRYEKYEMQWIGDFNIKMINVAESLGDTYRSRQLTTFRYLFDRTKEFKRHPMLA